MSILLVGGDRLGNITTKLRESGFQNIGHITGRKNGALKIKIPSNTDLILVLVDFISHKLTNVIKEESKRCYVKIAYSKRSWTYMEQTIRQCVKEIEDSNLKQI